MTFRAVFLGPPGAGKGTQALILATREDVNHVSTGDMLREHVARGTDLGRQAKSFMEGGRLVPDDLIIAMVEQRLALRGVEESGEGESGDGEAAETCRSWILDGFPRTLPQAEALERSLQKASKPLTHVVFFRVPHVALLKRLTGRWTCSECGAIWNVYFKPPAKEGVCDQCGGTLTQRSDDRPEAVGQRLEAYDNQTRPLLDFYRSRSCLVEIDADRSPKTVTAELVDALAKEVC